MHLEQLIEGTNAIIIALPAAAAVWQMGRKRKTASRDTPNHSPMNEVDQLLQDMQETIKDMHALQDKADHSNEWRNILNGTNRELANMSESIQHSMDQIERLVDTTAVGQAEHPSLESIEAVSTVASIASLQEDRRVRAHLYLSMGRSFDASGMAYSIGYAGNQGYQKMTFASGTSISDIISAFNQFVYSTGVRATESDEGLVRLSSQFKGSSQFVAARRVSGRIDNLILNRKKRRGSNRQIEFGRG